MTHHHRRKMSLKIILHLALICCAVPIYSSSSSDCELKINLQQSSSSDLISQVQNYLSGISYTISFPQNSQHEKHQHDQVQLSYKCEYNNYVHNALAMMYDASPRLRRASFGEAGSAGPEENVPTTTEVVVPEEILTEKVEEPEATTVASAPVEVDDDSDFNEDFNAPFDDSSYNGFNGVYDGGNSYDDYDDEESSVILNTAEPIFGQDGIPDITPNQVFTVQLSENIFIDENSKIAEKYQFSPNKEEFGSDWFSYDDDKRIFYALPFYKPPTENSQSSNEQAQTAPGTKTFDLKSNGLNTGGFVKVSKTIPEIKVDTKTWIFEAKFRKTSDAGSQLNPRKVLVDFSKAIREITNDNRVESFVVKDYFSTVDFWIVQWVNQTITNGCQYVRWGRMMEDESESVRKQAGIRSPIGFITDSNTKLGASRKEGDFSVTFMNVMSDLKVPISFLDSVKVLTKPSVSDCHVKTTTAEPTTTEKIDTTEERKLDLDSLGGSKQVFGGNCGKDFTNENIQFKYNSDTRLTYVLFSSELDENFTHVSDGCNFKHGKLNSEDILLTQTINLSDELKNDSFAAFIQIIKAIGSGDGESTRCSIHKKPDGSFEINLLKGDVEGSELAACEAVNKLNFIETAIDCSVLKGTQEEVPEVAETDDSVVEETPTKDISTGGETEQKENGLSVILIIILVAAALLFLLVGYKCYYDAQQKNAAPQYKPGTPSVFREEMDKTKSDRKPSNTLHANDDGSATALLNSSSDSTKKESQHIVVQPPPYP